MFFLEHPIIIFKTKTIRLNFLLKLSDLNSDFALTLGYFNLTLNNPAQIPFVNWSNTAAPFSFAVVVLSRVKSPDMELVHRGVWTEFVLPMTRSCRTVNNCNMNMYVRDGCVSYLQIKRFKAGFLPRSLRMRRDWISVFGRRGPWAS